MMKIVVTALFMTTPLIFSGVFHMWVVSKKYFAFLATPISAKHFGANKTWRGLVVMPLATVLGVWLVLPLESLLSAWLIFSFQESSVWVWGIYLGLGYVIAELPNSFIKRKIGIPEGKRPEKNGTFFALFDQADSAIGCAIVFLLIGRVDLSLAVSLVVIATAIHLLFNVLLFLFGLRKEAL